MNDPDAVDDDRPDATLGAESVSLAEVIRQSLAADLHDDLVPYLFVSQKSVAALLQKLDTTIDAESDHDQSRQAAIASLRQIDEWLTNAMRVSRGILQRSHAPDFKSVCWWNELQSLSERLHPTETRIRFAGHPPGDSAADIAMACYRVGAEAIRNAVRHSNANAIIVSTTEETNAPLLTIHDDGQGFDPAAVGTDRFGLVGMRMQANSVGARLAIYSKPGGPTRIELFEMAEAAFQAGE